MQNNCKSPFSAQPDILYYDSVPINVQIDSGY